MCRAKKIILVSTSGYDTSQDGLLRRLLARRIELFCVLGRDCRDWEEAMDWIAVGPTGEGDWLVTTSAHPDETLEEVLEAARMWRVDGCNEVEIMEV